MNIVDLLRTKKIISFFTLIAPQLVYANPFEGTLKVRGGREPIAGAAIYLLPHKIKITTQPDGSFTTENIPVGPFQWIINLPGYGRVEQQDESVDSTELQNRQLYAEANSTFVYETTITSNDKKDSANRTLKTKRARELPGAGLDPVKAIQNYPGVNRTPGFGAQVIVQGSAPRDTRYAIDGHEIPLIFHFGGLNSVLIPELSSDIDFYSAGYQSNYGRAMGGIINLSSSDLGSKYAHGMAYVDVFNTGAAFETPLSDHESLAVGARASYVGTILKSIAKNNENFNLSVAPSFNDVSIIYKNQIAPNLFFKTLAIASKDNLEFILSEPVGDDPILRGNFTSQIGFFRLIPQLTWTHSPQAKTKFSLGMGRDFINTKISDQYFNLKSTVMTARGEHDTQLTPTWNAIFGYDHRYAWSDVSFVFPQVNAEGGILNPISTGQTRVADLRSVKSHLLGIYWNNRIKPEVDSRWTFYPGARLDYFTAIETVNFSPRIGARYQLNPAWAFVSSGGLFAQPPQEQFSIPPYGNPNLSSEKAWHIIARAERDLSAEWSKGSDASSGVFYKSFYDLILPTNDQTFYSNLGKGESYGWENSVNYKMDPWSFYLAYTLSKSTRSDPKNGSYLFQYDQTHIATLISSVDLPRKWRISARYRYVTGPLDTIPTGSTFDSDNDVYIPIRGSLFNVRQSAFSQLDIRFDKKWVYDTWTLSLYLDIQNFLNTKNAEGFQNSYDYRTREPVSGIPVLPTFGLKGEF
jgi:hypothetical protein